ncbi:MAG: hypothetical protein EPN94_00610 [Nitrospirae bacterium]|nr:MAG: hypothetical protein EPN94_00610 [Nitrospirota bacterium]
MALFNYATKEITLKIVYYGPGLSGKTTNLQHLHSALDPQKTGKLLSLATETDRTLFFDFLPVELGKVKDFSVRFQLYTVPGQVKYDATRKVVLKGADAIIFVADSQKAMRDANLESFANMKNNLLSNNINPQDIPLVLQYNKRDLSDILSIAELNKDLNDGDYVYLEAEAVNGKGVQETFQVATKLLIKDIARKHKIEIQPAAKPEEPAQVIEEVIPPAQVEEKIFAAETAEEQIISFEEETAEEEKIPEANSLEIPQGSVSEEDFFFTEEIPQPAPPEQLIEEEKTEAEKPYALPIEPEPEKEISLAQEPLQSSETIEMPIEMPEVKKEIEETEEKWREPQIREVPVFPVEEFDKIRASIKEIPIFPIAKLDEEFDKIRASIKEIPILPIAKLDEMAEGIKETNQLLISLKAAIKELSDELRKTKEEQKEMLSIVREMKIAETVERIKGKGKKKGWFS